MVFKLSKTSLSRREGIDTRLIEIDDLAITISKVDFGHPEYAGLRTVEDQQELFNRGASQCDGITNRSKHQDGLALDFYAYVGGKASWHPPYLAIVATAYFRAAAILQSKYPDKDYELEWGGHWSTKEVIDGVGYGWDCGHIQLKSKE